MTPEAKRMLEQIDEFLDKRDRAAAEVAAVLTALRSNDYNDGSYSAEIKGATTCKIRAVALPISCKPAGQHAIAVPVGARGQRCMDTASVTADLSFIETPRSILIQKDTHFWEHLILAAEVLGIEIR